MSVQTATDAIPMPDGGRCQVYLARSPNRRDPAVVLIPPIFGTTPGIEQFAQKLSGEGFEVAVPDLFWRRLPGPLGYDGADRDKAQERYQAFDVQQGVDDLHQILVWCRSALSSSEKVGVVGICFGGRYAVLAASNLGASAAVSYHGTFIGKHIDVLPRIKCPVSMHFGESDPHVPMSEVAEISSATASNRNIEIFSYPDAPHGFMQQDRASYRAAVAELAWARGVSALKTGLTA